MKKIFVLAFLFFVSLAQAQSEGWGAWNMDGTKGNFDRALKAGYDSVVIKTKYPNPWKPDEPGDADAAPFVPDTLGICLLPLSLPPDTLSRAIPFSLYNPGEEQVTRKDKKGRVIFTGLKDTTPNRGHVHRYKAWTYDKKGRVLTSKTCGEKGCITWHKKYDRAGKLILETCKTRPDMLCDSITYTYNANGRLIDENHFYEGESHHRIQYVFNKEDLLQSVISWDRTAWMGQGEFTSEYFYFRRKKK